MSNTLLRVYPSDLKIPFGLKRQNSGIMELTNKTDQHVAFKVKTTNPRKYSVRPTSGVVLPRGSSGITVSMQAPREIPADYHCKDKFLIQSVVVEEGTASKDIHSGMFSKEPGKVVEEFKLRVVYIPANPPSPVPEEEEEDIDSLDSDVDYELKMPSTSYSASRLGYTSGSQASHNNEDLKKRRPSSVRGFSTLSVLLVFAFSVFAGYFMTQSNV
ncbi:vesicle-associated protein 1-3-like isoform X2 [Oryza brachyantha]|uniref:vesicle-associated protein 1-3-like isoform X2 n=1 Tax=Oryza brachyantha TaxID=4533 RepID=UPI00077643B3|nr:vesicle-associated protein 1-3-like isoform X2 [Oryza brachyantha]